VRDLSNLNAAAIIGARADCPFASVDDLWRRCGVPAAALVQIAAADAFQPSLKLAWREALAAIKALRDETLLSSPRRQPAKPRGWQKLKSLPSPSAR
jgi:error-prone DNA polymerase